MTKSFIIGICGGSGSGKTFLAKNLLRQFAPGKAKLLSLDNYYKSLADFPPEIFGNYDHPGSIDADLLMEHLQKLKSGQPFEVPCYEFSSHTRTGYQPFDPAPVVLVEGVLLFSLEALLPCMDLTIFVHADSDLRLIRRLRRDIVERGRSMDSVLEQYMETVRPMHLQHVEPGRFRAGMVVNGEGDPESVLRELWDNLKREPAVASLLATQ